MLRMYGENKINFNFDIEPFLVRARKVNKNFGHIVLVYILLVFSPLIFTLAVAVGILKLAGSRYLKLSFKNGIIKATHEV